MKSSLVLVSEQSLWRTLNYMVRVQNLLVSDYTDLGYQAASGDGLEDAEN